MRTWVAISCAATAVLIQCSEAEAVQEEQHRFLQSSCPYDNSMRTDAVWYELDIALFSQHQIECSQSESNSIRTTFDTALSNADLWSNGLNIVILNQHICNNGQAQGRNLFKRDNDSSLATSSNRDGRRRELMAENPLSFLKFFSFFPGGGRCVLCVPDDQDHSHNRGLQQLPSPPSLRGNSNNVSASRPEESSSLQRRRTNCGGCFTLDFNKDGDGNAIAGTPYIHPKEYWDSHGVRIQAYGGYTPDSKARIYDSSFYATNNHNGDPDLGSPNEHCPGGGPGKGNGGKPTLSNGDPNPGANCVEQGNVLIVQESNKAYADDNGSGGQIKFTFRYPVTLESVGLMDIDEGGGDFIEVDSEFGYQKHYVSGFGDNSIETVVLNVKKVTKLYINLPGSGAVRYLKFCHDCGEEEQVREQQIQAYYPSDSVRSYENQATVYHFNNLVPNINVDVSGILQSALDDAHTSDPSSCLYNKNPQVQAHMITSTPGPANNCNHNN